MGSMDLIAQFLLLKSSVPIYAVFASSRESIYWSDSTGAEYILRVTAKAKILYQVVQKKKNHHHLCTESV